MRPAGWQDYSPRPEREQCGSALSGPLGQSGGYLAKASIVCPSTALGMTEVMRSFLLQALFT
jgi:hypothetical protein